MVDPRTTSGRVLPTGGEQARRAPGDDVVTRDELERALAECCEAAFQQGWSSGYAAGCSHSKPVLGVPRRELEKWVARAAVVAVVLFLAGPFLRTLLAPW